MINKNKLGLAVGTFLGLCHFFWAWLVLTGMAQSVLNWIFQLHFIQPTYTLLPFSIGAAAGLVILNFAIGYAGGYLAGAVCNWLRADPERLAPLQLRKPATGH
jgi:hypothetical protein